MTILEELATKAEEALTVKRVFGEPYAKNGTTVIPVASVSGGFGGGSGGPVTTSETGEIIPAGTGGASVLRARPSGVYVVKGDDVKWLPAVDVNRMLMGMQIVAVIALLSLRSIMKARAQHQAA
jgi:uncharacterized spore protein YtfJ